MDAYTSYIMSLSEARASELRREAAEYALSRAARGQRSSLRARLQARLKRRARPVMDPVTPVPLPAPVPEADLRRSA